MNPFSTTSDRPVEALNICRVGSPQENDPHFRYWMDPCVLTDVRKKGGFAVFANVDQVAQKLHVRPVWLMKWIGYELAVRVEYKTEKTENKPNKQKHSKAQPAVGVIYAKVTEKRIQALIYRFVEAVVLCRKCSLPEVTLSVGTKTSGDKEEHEVKHEAALQDNDDDDDDDDRNKGKDKDRKTKDKPKAKAKTKKLSLQASCRACGKTRTISRGDHKVIKTIVNDLLQNDEAVQSDFSAEKDTTDQEFGMGMLFIGGVQLS